MRPPDHHHQQASLFIYELLYSASPTTIKEKKSQQRSKEAHAYIFHLQHSSSSYVRRGSKTKNKAWMIISATNSQFIYGAVCHSHKELLIGQKEKSQLLLTDKQCRENTNHGNSYKTRETEASNTKDTQEKFHPEILFCLKVFTAAIRWRQL